MVEFSFNNLFCLVQHSDTLGGRQHISYIPKSNSGKGYIRSELGTTAFSAVTAPWKGEGNAFAWHLGSKFSLQLVPGKRSCLPGKLWECPIEQSEYCFLKLHVQLQG